MKSAWLTLVLLAAGCSSVSVDPESIILTREIHPPENIYVRPLDTKTGEWTPPTGEEAETFKASQNASLTRDLIDALEQIAPAQAAPDPLPKQGLLVTGEFITIDAVRGTAATRLLVYDLSKLQKAPVAWFEASASGGLDAAWEKTAAAAVDFLETKIGRKSSGFKSPEKHSKKK